NRTEGKVRSPPLGRGYEQRTGQDDFRRSPFDVETTGANRHSRSGRGNMSGIREPDSEPIPGYRLIQPLGSGGFGEVWKCEAPGGLFKAIKFVYGNLNSLDLQGARAEQELHALNRVKEVRHPFIVSMDRIEVVDGELVIVMELADRSLYDYFVECQSA